MEPQFVGWSKIPRWKNETYTITEKLDGTKYKVIMSE